MRRQCTVFIRAMRLMLPQLKTLPKRTLKPDIFFAPKRIRPLRPRNVRVLDSLRKTLQAHHFFFLDKNDPPAVDSVKAIGCEGEIPL